MRRGLVRGTGFKTWLTADLHFYHSKMVGLRGFSSVDEMHEHMVTEWNRRIQEGDTVYILGDVSFAGGSATRVVLSQLRGKLMLVPGNHDESMNAATLACFERVLPPIHELKHGVHQPDGSTDVHRFILCHFPIGSWKGMHHGAIHLHGHSHGHYPARGRMLDVGVDNTVKFAREGGAHVYAPVLIDDILDHMKTRTFVPVDQHTEKAA